MAERLLDIENIGRIGQMLISGDLLTRVLVDDYTWDEDDTRYRFSEFNTLKWALMKTERLNPDICLSGALWLWYRANRRMVVPVIVDQMRPRPGHVILPGNPALMETLLKGVNTTRTHEDGAQAHYFPIRNSLDAIVGALELTTQPVKRPFAFRYDTVRP